MNGKPLSSQQRWTPGDHIILRTVLPTGRIGTVLPTTVVQDTEELVALYLAPGTRCKRRMGKRGGPRGRQLIEDSGRHEDWPYSENRRLVLWQPHDMHAVSLFWRDADDAFLCWYIDILRPFQRAAFGFDTRDLELDVVIQPDRSWQLKDEDELVWREEQGIMSPDDVSAIRAEADRAIALFESGDSRYAAHWTEWRPDPSWPIPTIPEGWEIVTTPPHEQ